MDKWFGKVALVTGSSVGIGACISVSLVNVGMKVVGVARRIELVEELKSKVTQSKRNNLHPYKCDLSNPDEIDSLFVWINNNLGGVDVLINNAAVMHNASITGIDKYEEVSIDTLNSIIDTNVKAFILCTQRAVKYMKRKDTLCYIININSVCGHVVPVMEQLLFLNVYPATKAATLAITRTVKAELSTSGSKIKITSLSPGRVDTDMLKFNEGPSPVPQPKLSPEDVSDAVLYLLSTKPNVNVSEFVIQPVGENYY